jgi:nucleoside-triphosphatase THEP1
MTTSIIILTGERGAGKTSACREAVTLAQAKEYACNGILTLTQPDGELDVLDVSNGETRRLTLPPDTKPAIVQGRFHFAPETFGWGNLILADATSCHLFVVDELGPLELEQRRGWTKAFDVLQRRNFALALAVVRPELVIKAQLCLPGSATTVLSVAPENRDGLPAALLEILERNVSPSPND